MKTTLTTARDAMKTYLFEVEVVQEEDGRWSVGIPTLPGCATWGYTRDEALRNIHDAVEAYIRDMRNAGEPIPEEAALRIVSEPVVAVTV